MELRSRGQNKDPPNLPAKNSIINANENRRSGHP